MALQDPTYDDHTFFKMSDPSHLEGMVSRENLEITQSEVELDPPPADPEPEPAVSKKDFREAPYLEPFSDENLPASLNVTLANSTKVIPSFSSFFLTSANEQDMEKLQITDTGGQFWAHFYGRKPRVWGFTGNLVSAKNHDWPTLWDALYERYLRGTRCAELGAKVQLTYANKSIYGWMINSAKAYSADNEHGVGLSFQILVDSEELIRQQQVLEDRYGIGDVDGIASLGDLTSLDAITARVAELDSLAAELVNSVLSGTSPVSTIAVPK
jgi:hypothetical protein